MKLKTVAPILVLAALPSPASAESFREMVEKQKARTYHVHGHEEPGIGELSACLNDFTTFTREREYRGVDSDLLCRKIEATGLEPFADEIFKLMSREEKAGNPAETYVNLLRMEALKNLLQSYSDLTGGARFKRKLDVCGDLADEVAAFVPQAPEQTVDIAALPVAAKRLDGLARRLKTARSAVKMSCPGQAPIYTWDVDQDPPAYKAIPGQAGAIPCSPADKATVQKNEAKIEEFETEIALLEGQHPYLALGRAPRTPEAISPEVKKVMAFNSEAESKAWYQQQRGEMALQLESEIIKYCSTPKEGGYSWRELVRKKPLVEAVAPFSQFANFSACAQKQAGVTTSESGADLGLAAGCITAALLGGPTFPFFAAGCVASQLVLTGERAHASKKSLEGVQACRLAGGKVCDLEGYREARKDYDAKIDAVILNAAFSPLDAMDIALALRSYSNFMKPAELATVAPKISRTTEVLDSIPIAAVDEAIVRAGYPVNVTAVLRGLKGGERAKAHFTVIQLIEDARRAKIPKEKVDGVLKKYFAKLADCVKKN